MTACQKAMKVVGTYEYRAHFIPVEWAEQYSENSYKNMLPSVHELQINIVANQPTELEILSANDIALSGNETDFSLKLQATDQYENECKHSALTGSSQGSSSSSSSQGGSQKTEYVVDLSQWKVKCQLLVIEDKEDDEKDDDGSGM
jgi:hypothetical protein